MPTSTSQDKNDSGKDLAPERLGTRFVRPLIVVLLALHALLLLHSARENFVTIDEIGHLAAGLSHWETGTYSMYRVNPPLARMVAVIPVTFAHPVTAGISPSPAPGHRNEWPSGRQFAVDNAGRYCDLVTLARLPGVAWSCLGGLLIFCWARQLYGNAAGCLGLALWCLGPNVLAYAQLAIPDVPATVAGLAATYAFWHYLRSPSWARASLAGVLLGVAQLTKFTLLLLYGVWPLLWLAFQIRRNRDPARPTARLGTSAAHALAVVSISLLVVNAGYEFQGSFRPLGDLPFISKTFAGNRPEGSAGGNRFRDTWLADVPVPLPDQVLLGIDQQRHDFESHFPSYLAGQWRDHGWWYYYLYALAVKVPLGTWALVLWGIVLTLTGHPASAPWRDEMALWLPALAVLVLVSSQTGFNHHMRYVLPMFPFVLISTSKLAYFLRPARWKAGLAVVVLLGWSVASSLSIHPHYLSYFNELAGGPEHGHDHLVDSNIDWGQDLLFLKEWLDEHPEAQPLGLAYFNTIDPRIVGIQFTLPPTRPTGCLPPNEEAARRFGPRPGYFAVSVHYLRGASRIRAPDGKGGHVALPPLTYTYFRHFQPIARAGYSIYIYHVTPEEANRVRAHYGLPPLPSPDTRARRESES